MISHVNCFIHSDDLVLVLGTFTLSGRRGPSVVLRKQEQGGEILIRMLIAETADEWNVRQYNPERTSSLPKAEWPICHRIVGKNEVE